MQDATRVAEAANVLARWCAQRDVSRLGRQALAEEAGLANGMADLFVLFGGGVVGTVTTLARAMNEGVAKRYAIVGGRGHATYWLDQATERLAETSRLLPVAGTASEAEMLDAVLRDRYGLEADFLETRSTNCGNNITYLLDCLEEEEVVPESVILSQDAVMQRRMGATWRRTCMDRPAFGRVQVFMWPAYEAELAAEGDALVWHHAPEGIWPIDTYLGMLAGEVMRLTDDENGYGPRGRDFVAHVDIPDEVRAQAETLRSLWTGDVRTPDERYG